MSRFYTIPESYWEVLASESQNVSMFCYQKARLTITPGERIYWQRQGAYFAKEARMILFQLVGDFRPEDECYELMN